MTRLLPALALALTACLHQPPGWSVQGGTPEQTTQALALVEAARTISGQPLRDGSISLTATPHGLGYRDGETVTGLGGSYLGRCGVDVLIWEERGLGPDLTTTALAHEICHCWDVPQAEADACGALIVAEYRRANQ